MGDVTLYCSRGSAFVVDADDALALLERRWHSLSKRDYLFANVTLSCGKHTTLYLHRMLMGAGRGQIVDHVDGNPRNNTRRNLRLCTQRDNARNARRKSNSSATLKGVSFVARTGRWRAGIRVDGRNVHLGYFMAESEAHEAYCRAAAEAYGEFARTE